MSFSGSGKGSILETADNIQATCTASCVKPIPPGSVVTVSGLGELRRWHVCGLVGRLLRNYPDMHAHHERQYNHRRGIQCDEQWWRTNGWQPPDRW